jgi:hypothetical protein
MARIHAELEPKQTPSQANLNIRRNVAPAQIVPRDVILQAIGNIATHTTESTFDITTMPDINMPMLLSNLQEKSTQKGFDDVTVTSGEEHIVKYHAKATAELNGLDALLCVIASSAAQTDSAAEHITRIYKSLLHVQDMGVTWVALINILKQELNSRYETVPALVKVVQKIRDDSEDSGSPLSKYEKAFYEAHGLAMAYVINKALIHG